MRLKILKRSTSAIKAKLVKSAPEKITHGGLGVPTKITFKGGIEVAGSCLHCPDTPCMSYSATEKLDGVFAAFPADTTPEVCPTNAMKLNETSGAPEISKSDCISCGLCVQRCAVFAITLSKTGATVNDNPNAIFTLSEEPADQTTTDAISRAFKKTPIQGTIIENGETLLPAIYERIANPPSGANAQFPNLLIRNLMRGLGISWEMRRQGDTNIRMDAAFHAPRIGIAEVEFSETATLDSPRSILDACAVLVARHKIKLDEITPAIITLSLPNSRSEYWRVIKDIRDILGLKIESITVGALLLMLWENRKLDLGGSVSFYADTENESIASGLSATLGRKPLEEKGYRGWLKAGK